MIEISVKMQAVINQLNEENGALQVALDNANDALAEREAEWQTIYNKGKREAWGEALRCVVMKLGQDADDELNLLAGERQQGFDFLQGINFTEVDE